MSLSRAGKAFPQVDGWSRVAREKPSRQSETLDCWHGAETISNACLQHRGYWIARHATIWTARLPVFWTQKNGTWRHLL